MDTVEALQAQGVTVLKWASGPRTADKPSDYVKALDPQAPGFRFAGAGIDEWNTRNKTVEETAATGYREAKRQYPSLFLAAWVTGIDSVFSSLMADGTFDV